MTSTAMLRSVYPLAVGSAGILPTATVRCGSNISCAMFSLRGVRRPAAALAEARPGVPRHGDGEISEGTAAHPPADAAGRGGDGARQRPPLPREVSRTIWSGRHNWHQGDHLAKAAARAGLDFAELDAEVARDSKKLDAIIVASQEARRKGGHDGVPLMVFDGERSSARTV